MIKSVTRATAILLLATASASAQVQGSSGPGTITQGEAVGVTLIGLTPNTDYTVVYHGHSDDVGTESNASRVVTTDSEGMVTWVEYVSWPEGDYTTYVKWQLDGGHFNTTHTNPLTVKAP